MPFPHGLNLGPVNYWTDCPFIDQMRGSGPWGGKAAIGADGWPAGTSSDEATINIPVETVPTEYTLIVTQGQITAARAQPGEKAVQIAPDRWTFTASAAAGHGAMLRFSPAGTGPVRIAIVRSDLMALHDAGEVFKPAFLAAIDGAYCLRFMDWAQVNKPLAPVPAMDAPSWAAGVPVSVMAQLCNRVRSHMWMNVRHDVPLEQSVAQVTEAASLLDEGLSLYVEMSNEMWNTIFPQGKWALAQPGGPDRAYGVLAGNLANALQGTRARVPLCNQFGNSGRAKAMFAGYDSTGAPRSMIAFVGVAPYISPPRTIDVQALAVANDKAGLLKVLTDRQSSLVDAMRKWAAIAKGNGLGLVAYEHNLSLYPMTPEQTALFEAVAHSPEGAALIDKNMADFAAAGGLWACFFNSVGIGGKSGFWGMTPAYDAPGYPTQRRWDRANMLAWKSMVVG